MKKELTVEIVRGLIDKEKARDPKKEAEVRDNPCMNFLLSLPNHTSKYEDSMNLEQDAKMYRWKPGIVRVIKAGIKLAHE